MQPIERSAQNISTCGSNWLQWRKKLEAYDQLHGTRSDWEKLTVWPSDMEAQNYIALSQLKKEFLFSLVQADRFWAKPLEIFAVCGKVCRFRISNKLPIPQTLFNVLLWLDSEWHWSFEATYESVQLFVIPLVMRSECSQKRSSGSVSRSDQITGCVG
jgi:hypothetical protein